MTDDPLDPQHLICLACAVPRRDLVTDQVVRDALGFIVYGCEMCRGRTTDQLCECFLCPWLREGTADVR